MRTNTVLIGGERQVFFKAGTAVPSVKAEDNKDGIYQLTVPEMKAIVNP